MAAEAAGVSEPELNEARVKADTARAAQRRRDELRRENQQLQGVLKQFLDEMMLIFSLSVSQWKSI